VQAEREKSQNVEEMHNKRIEAMQQQVNEPFLTPIYI
jgi:hypothetical protein